MRKSEKKTKITILICVALLGCAPAAKFYLVENLISEPRQSRKVTIYVADEIDMSGAYSKRLTKLALERNKNSYRIKMPVSEQ